MARPAENHPRPQGTLPDSSHLDRAVEPEYASVSVAAIAALALAALGLTALLPVDVTLALFPGWFQVPLLIFIPLGTIPFALAVMRSIRRSAGTKVGLPLAQAALVLALLATVGSAALHGARQYREHRLLETLVEDSDRYLESLLKGDYRSVFDELARNNPPPGSLEEQFEFWKKNFDDFLYKGGDYYGRTLSTSQRFPPERPEDPPGGLGLVVYKFRFSEGILNIRFIFRLDDGQLFGPYGWKLMAVRPERAYEFPEADEKPKKRFE